MPRSPNKDTITVLINSAAVKIKTDQILTKEEERYCISNYEAFLERLDTDDLFVYYSKNIWVKAHTNLKLWEYWRSRNNPKEYWENKNEIKKEIVNEFSPEINVVKNPQSAPLILPVRNNASSALSVKSNENIYPERINAGFAQVKTNLSNTHHFDTTYNQPNKYSWKTLIGIIVVILAFALAANFHSQLTPASVSVSGYYRSDGTYIHPYNRRPPNSVEHDKPYAMGMIFFGLIGIVGCAIVAIKIYSYRE